jgi:hypothetical protein
MRFVVRLRHDGLTSAHAMSVVACSDAEVFIDGKSVYTFTPKGVMDIQQQLFYSADYEQTFARVICLTIPNRRP